MNEEIFILNNVSFRYLNGVLALKNVSMKVYRGEILGIIGPNGAGKSTLLMILDGLLFPSEGEVYAFGKRISKSLFKNDDFRFNFRRRVGFVFQDPDVQLFSSTVRDDVAFAPRHLNLGEEEVKERVRKALTEMGILHLANKHPYNLSVGEKRKASIATILSMDPDVIIFDEPTTNLEPASKNELLNIIRRLIPKGKTFIIATHDLNFIAQIATRIYLLNKTIIAEGEPFMLLSDEKLMKENRLEVPLFIKCSKSIHSYKSFS